MRLKIGNYRCICCRIENLSKICKFGDMEDEMIRNCIVLGFKYNYICKKVVEGNEIGFFMLYRYM